MYVYTVQLHGTPRLVQVLLDQTARLKSVSSLSCVGDSLPRLGLFATFYVLCLGATLRCSGLRGRFVEAGLSTQKHALPGEGWAS